MLGPSKGLEGLRIGHDITLQVAKSRQFRDKNGDVSHDSPRKVTVNDNNE